MKTSHVHLSESTIKQASNTDLVDYLSSCGYEVVKRGNSYKLNIKNRFPGDMSSLSVYANRKGWKRWSNGESGGDAISFLEKNMSMNFQEAVCALTNNTYICNSEKMIDQTITFKEKILKLPDKYNGRYSRLFAYLTATRMIDPDIVNELIHKKLIYQDKYSNIVFVGFDENKTERFACIRGTNTEKVFRADCDNSDKRFAFSLSGINKKKLFVFEAPIDLLSHATMSNKIIQNPKAWKVHSRLCLAGTSDVALNNYLKTHADVNEIIFYLDNDEAGRNAAEKHCKKYHDLGYKVSSCCPKNKDINEDLIEFVGKKPPPACNTKQNKRSDIKR
ncbi:MAG: DUF3991 and TOPRIM domain-containing protein [Oscillospiraceae bacterium]|nr:DUF3991 and TOPRIM domain-containing protein [Oscillospiraceae bacterium]